MLLLKVTLLPLIVAVVTPPLTVPTDAAPELVIERVFVPKVVVLPVPV